GVQHTFLGSGQAVEASEGTISPVARRHGRPPAAQSLFAGRRAFLLLAETAERALDLPAHEASAAFGREHPGALLERRLVADVLSVAARQIGDPGAGLVRVGAEGEDASAHGEMRCG